MRDLSVGDLEDLLQRHGALNVRPNQRAQLFHMVGSLVIGALLLFALINDPSPPHSGSGYDSGSGRRMTAGAAMSDLIPWLILLPTLVLFGALLLFRSFWLWRNLDRSGMIVLTHQGLSARSALRRSTVEWRSLSQIRRDRRLFDRLILVGRKRRGLMGFLGGAESVAVYPHPDAMEALTGYIEARRPDLFRQKEAGGSR